MAYKTIYSKPTGNKLPGSDTTYNFRTVTRYEVDSNGKATGKSTSQLYYSPVPAGRTKDGQTWSAGNEDGENFNPAGYALAAESTDGGGRWTPKPYTQANADAISGIGDDRVGKNVLGTTALQSLTTPGGRFYDTAQNSIINTAVQTEAGLAPKLAKKLKNAATEEEDKPIPASEPTPEEKKTGLLDGDSFSGEVKSIGRNKFPENLVFPTGLGSTEQDVVIFDMLEYIPQNFDGKFSVQSTNRKSSERGIGRVTLPIPAGISDANSVTWSGQNMNAIDVVLGNIALVGTTKGLGAAANTALEIGKEIQQNSDELRTGAAAGFAGMASGVGAQLLTRTTGAIFNPNMELLFSAPSLRPFAFNFLLAPRNDAEAQSIRSIIRFFKQGSAPQKSPAGLFLKSPHTFKIGYKHRGSEQSHPYLNKFKECALQSVSVQYTPNGNYATVGENGAMASYQMSLQFQELEPVFNEDYGSGSGSSGPDTEIGF